MFRVIEHNKNILSKHSFHMEVMVGKFFSLKSHSELCVSLTYVQAAFAISILFGVRSLKGVIASPTRSVVQSRVRSFKGNRALQMRLARSFVRRLVRSFSGALEEAL